jgi:hypothetical protein
VLTVSLRPAGKLCISCVEKAELSTGQRKFAIFTVLSTSYAQVKHRLSTGFKYKLLICKAFHLYQFVRNCWREKANDVTIRVGCRLALKTLR